ncbi:MAG: response regulator [Roseobacter sp.]
MPYEASAGGLAEDVGTQLPYLRRYSRALTGSQETGDRYAAATLEALLTDASVYDSSLHPKIALFKVFHTIWHSSSAPSGAMDSHLTAAAHGHLEKLTANSREVLLMSVIEGFSANEIGQIAGMDKSEVGTLLDAAYSEMKESMTGNVMIIEDESLIAMDLESMVADMGHDVTGIARTHKAAVALAAQKTPDLILADIHLADNSSGIDAVKEIMTTMGERPVIFITAYPERLLTGDRHEPAFMIAKPYTEEQVTVAVSQAMFFSSTETLKA